VPANPQAQERQRPLRALYRERPDQAVTAKWARTSSASVSAADPFHGEVEIGRGYGAKMRFGLDGHVGGLHDLPNPGDLLCAAVAACEDGTLAPAVKSSPALEAAKPMTDPDVISEGRA
jgi:hypothetical protein